MFCSFKKQDVEAIVYDDGDPDKQQATLGGQFRWCSHGQSLLTRQNSFVPEPIKLNCSGISSAGTPYNSQYCDYADFLGWQEAAVDALAAAGIDANQYAYKLIIVPPSTACTWVGLGYVGCDFTFPCASWVQSDVLMGAKRGAGGAVQAAAHEIGQ